MTASQTNPPELAANKLETQRSMMRPKAIRPSGRRGLRKRGPMKAPHFRAVAAYLRSAGATHVRAISGGKHPRITYEWRGEASFYVMACTPRDADEAARNAIHALRRRLAISE